MIHGFDQMDTGALFEGAILPSGYWPGKGIVYSLLFHAMTLSAVLYISVSGVLSETRLAEERRRPIEQIDLREVVYLPVLGGDTAPAPGEPADADTAPPAPPEGLSYPGPQEMLSEVPDATNSFQTLLRESLENPEVLDPSLGLPNLVQFRDRPAVVQAEAPSREVLVAPVREPPEARAPLDLDPRQIADLSALAANLEAPEPLPSDRPPDALPARSLEASSAADLSVLPRDRNPLQALPVRQADLALPMRTLEPREAADLTELAAERRRVEALPVREAAAVLPARGLDGPGERDLAVLDAGGRSLEALPVAPLPSVLPNRRLDPAAGGDGDALEDILALSPMPAARPGPLPAGEARGVFAISTKPNLDAAGTRPGVRAEDAAGEGDREVSLGEYLASRGTAEGVSTTSAGPVPADEVAGGGGAPGSVGGGTATGPEAGPGTAPNPFPGITILAGGATPPRSPAANGIRIVGGSTAGEVAPLAPDADAGPEGKPGFLQRSYGVTVVTTESSGGGLPEFGVFTDEQVHTVFFDMRRQAGDPTPQWTVEYGVPRGARVETRSTGDPAEIVPGFLLPFPVDRVQPAFPAHIAERFPEQMVIVYAVINTEGRLEDITVKQSPDPRFVQPVHDALSRWTFRAARRDGAAVPLKMLVGIPLWQ